jgi:putative SOS response-associated peptidase YedK
MCGRFTLSQSADTIADVFHLSQPLRVDPRYNIAPTQPVPVIRATVEQPDRQFTYLYWGLIPSWAKDPAMGARMINARAETVAEKPAFRAAFKRRRCLVLADGFYEWQRQGRKKQPFYFCMRDRQPFAFAGLWEHWESANGELESCTILTTDANDVLRPVHDRMPVILDPDNYDLWLDPTMQTTDRLHALLHPYADDPMIGYPVSTEVNNPKSDSSDYIQPLVKDKGN